METFLAICAIAVLIYGIRYTRRKAIRLQEAAELRQSEERVKAQWVSVDMSEETTPPTDLPMSYEEDETQEVDCEAVRQAEDFLMSLADLEDMGE
jgi:diaminopimelate epimerase